MARICQISILVEWLRRHFKPWLVSHGSNQPYLDFSRVVKALFGVLLRSCLRPWTHRKVRSRLASLQSCCPRKLRFCDRYRKIWPKYDHNMDCSAWLKCSVQRSEMEVTGPVTFFKAWFVVVCGGDSDLRFWTLVEFRFMVRPEASSVQELMAICHSQFGRFFAVFHWGDTRSFCTLAPIVR